MNVLEELSSANRKINLTIKMAKEGRKFDFIINNAKSTRSVASVISFLSSQDLMSYNIYQYILDNDGVLSVDLWVWPNSKILMSNYIFDRFIIDYLFNISSSGGIYDRSVPLDYYQEF